jgi:hypothetical protein
VKRTKERQRENIGTRGEQRENRERTNRGNDIL